MKKFIMFACSLVVLFASLGCGGTTRVYPGRTHYTPSRYSTPSYRHHSTPSYRHRYTPQPIRRYTPPVRRHVVPRR